MKENIQNLKLKISEGLGTSNDNVQYWISLKNVQELSRGTLWID